MSYFIMALVCYFFIRVPIVMLIYNILYFMILTLNYKAEWKQRIMVAVYIYSLLFVIEMLVAALSGYVHFPLDSGSNYLSLFGEIGNQLIGLVIVYMISAKKRVKGTVALPMVYWLCIIIMPLVSLYSLVLLFHMGNLNRSYLVLCMIFLLAVNFSVMVFYDLVVKSMSERTRGVLLEQQNKYYEGQFELLKASAKMSDSLQHDLNKHLISVRSYLNNNQVQEAAKYIDKIIDIDFSNLTDLFVTGNAIVDGILNIKLQEAKNKDIIVNTKLQIPENLNVDPCDITVILGNILDNAIEAASRVVGERKINILFIYNRGRILLKAENTYSEKIVIKQGTLQTGKSDKMPHGIGLQNTRYAVEKYHGMMDIHYNDKWFEICIMLYV